jgi:hypothetical protein
MNTNSRLTVSANGRAVSSYDSSASSIITSLLRPGDNALVFNFSAPGGAMQLNCTPPGASEGVQILRFEPIPGKLEERITVNITPRRR